MPVRLQEATDRDAASIAAVRMATSRQLTAKYGRGTWSFAAESEWGVRADIMTSNVYVVRDRGIVAATLRLSTRPPWIGDISFFSPVRTPLYLTTMSVLPRLQGKGIGRICLEQVKQIALNWPADAIRLDAYDSPAGAGDFYRKSGFTEVRRAEYNGTPLVYFEWLVRASAPSNDTLPWVDATSGRPSFGPVDEAG